MPREFAIDDALEVDPREAKLPVWARDKLRIMRAATTEARGNLAALRDGAEPGPFWFEHWDPQRRGERFYLPTTLGKLKFGDPTEKDVSGQLEFKATAEGVEISTCHGGDQTPMIEPLMSNQFLVRCVERPF